jgi:P-type E1-E2 ATPase
VAREPKALAGSRAHRDLVRDAKQVRAAMAIADRIKPPAAEAIARLKAAGIKVYMQTGDSRRTAQAVAKAVGIDDFRSEVLPKDKAAFVTGCSSKGTWWPWWAMASTTARRWPRPT